LFGEGNIVQKIERWKPVSKRLIGRHEMRWEGDVLGDVRSLEVRNWKEVAENRDSWRRVVGRARNCTGCSALGEEE
jgi:hypothetical protein